MHHAFPNYLNLNDCRGPRSTQGLRVKQEKRSNNAAMRVQVRLRAAIFAPPDFRSICFRRPYSANSLSFSYHDTNQLLDDGPQYEIRLVPLHLFLGRGGAFRGSVSDHDASAYIPVGE